MCCGEVFLKEEFNSEIAVLRPQLIIATEP